MQYLTILGLLGICAVGTFAMVPPLHYNPGSAVVIPTPPPAPTMAQDLDELMRMVPMLPIHQLTIRYLLNDAQFQAFVRIINSNDAYVTQMRFRSQPEVMSLLMWMRAQIMLSGGEFVLEEAEELLTIFNRTPFWGSTVSGWQGFVNEFLMYYPQDMIRVHIQMKVAQNGIFAQFIQRLKALKPVFDRVIAFPEAQRLAAALQANGIDVVGLDTFIRNQFGWQHPPTVAPPTTTAAPTTTTLAPATTTVAPTTPLAPVSSTTAAAAVDSSTSAAPVSSTAAVVEPTASVAAPVAPVA